MWSRFMKYLQCPQCAGSLDLYPFRESRENISEELLNLAHARKISTEELSHWVDSGALQCHTCEVTFPIWHGLPILSAIHNLGP